MAKKKGSPFIGGLFLVAVVVGGGIQLMKANPLLGVFAIVCFFFISFLILLALRKKRCEVCSNIIERKSFQWKVNGENKRVCVHCNQSFAKKQSRRATQSFR